MPAKVISRFFDQLVVIWPLDSSSVPYPTSSEFEANSYLAMINAREGNSVDSCGSGVEVQIDSDINVRHWLSAVILHRPSSTGDRENLWTHL